VRALFAAVLLTFFAQAQTQKSIADRIRIEKAPAGKMRFSPVEIVAWAGAQIHWYNTTAEAHEPGILKEDGRFVAFLEEPVAAGAASAVFSPLARIDEKGNLIPFTIHYICGLHRNEQGSIQVIPTP
jgi:plastocyanin